MYLKQNLPTRELMERCGELSIHQLGAQRTLMMIKKIILSKKPSYLSSKLIVRESGPRTTAALIPVAASLNITRESFLYRGIKLFNLLPEEIRSQNTISVFKADLKEWIRGNISVKP